jgi:hypothetical protein
MAQRIFSKGYELAFLPAKHIFRALECQEIGGYNRQE